MAVHACHPSIWEIETGSSDIQAILSFWLHTELEASLDYMRLNLIDKFSKYLGFFSQENGKEVNILSQRRCSVFG